MSESFFWGFIAASNSIFIPFCRTHFNLDQFQSQLIGSAFYVAYFVGSLFILCKFNFNMDKKVILTMFLPLASLSVKMIAIS